MNPTSTEFVTSEDRNSLEDGASPHRTNGIKAEEKSDIQNECIASSRSTLSQSVPVNLRLQIGQLEIPFSQIQTMTAGHVFSLGKPLTDEMITIYANEVAVAIGELVNIDGFVGVQVRRMLIANGLPASQQSTERHGSG